RLPLHGGFDPMREAVRDIPFVARRANRPRADTRRLLALDLDESIVLASFGGYALRLPYDEIARGISLTVIVTDDRTGRAVPSGGRIRTIDSRELLACGLRYEDLV